MSTEDNKAVVRRFAQAIAEHDLQAVGELVAEDAVWRVPISPEPLVGRDAVRQLFAGFFAAFSDFRPEIREQVAEGDRVVTHALLLGTNDGELMGMPPSGRAMSLDVVHLHTVRDGVLKDDFVIFDRAALMEQLQSPSQVPASAAP